MKDRLTITLSASTLAKIDQLIDKKKIRNRSHAIEYILEKTLKPSITTAIILAGGQPQADNTVRAMTILDDKPLIAYTLEHLQKFGVDTVFIATNQAGHAIETLVGDGSHFGLNVQYVYETEQLGTAGALRNLKHLLPPQACYVISGDVLTTINLTDMCQFHTTYHSLVTMAVKPRITKDTYDNVFIQGHTIVDFQKSTADQTVSLVNASVYIFEPEAFEYIPDKTPSMLEQDVFPQLAKRQNLLAFPFQGIWFDITSDTNYQTALKKINSTVHN